MTYLNGKRKKPIRVWLVLCGYNGKLDFVRSHRKGFRSVFCCEKRADAMEKLRAIRKTYLGINVKIISATAMSREVR